MIGYSLESWSLQFCMFFFVELSEWSVRKRLCSLLSFSWLILLLQVSFFTTIFRSDLWASFILFMQRYCRELSIFLDAFSPRHARCCKEGNPDSHCWACSGGGSQLRRTSRYRELFIRFLAFCSTLFFSPDQEGPTVHTEIWVWSIPIHLRRVLRVGERIKGL